MTVYDNPIALKPLTVDNCIVYVYSNAYDIDDDNLWQ